METTVTIERITPELAADYLKHNHNNRNIRRNIVLTYINDMKQGRWVITTDGIGFDTEGRLTNGQHRLTACVESGVTIMCAVFRNLPVISFRATDNGMGRTASDAIMDASNATTVAASIKTLTRIRGGNIFVGNKATKNIKLSNALSEEIYRGDQDGFNKAAAIARSFIDKQRYINALRPGLLSGLIYYLMIDKGHSEEQVRYFFGNVLSLRSSNDETLELLRIRLIADAVAPVKMTAQLKQNLIAKTWNAYLRGKKCKQLKWDSRREGEIPFM